jgi:hypothetical protein
MRIKIKLIILLLFLFLIPFFAFADRGMIVWPPEVHLDQSAQNAIVAWNGKEEIIILSTSIKSESSATVLEILPLPANPTEIKEGNFEVFEKLVKVMNEKIKKIQKEGRKWLPLGKGNLPSEGIEIVFHKEIGAHDITVVKVNNLNSFINWIRNFAKKRNLGIKEISMEFKNGLKNYLKRGINYFVFDVIDVKGEKSIKPIIYKFRSDYFYYPMLISGVSEISESKAKIKLFLIIKEKSPREILVPIFYQQWIIGYPVKLTQIELAEISQDIKNLFDSSVYVQTYEYSGYLKEFKKDIIFYPKKIWRRYLGIGSRGKDVKALQKILINEGFWNSDVGATGYFGPITKNALIKFQETFKEIIVESFELNKEILNTFGLNLEKGYFGPITKEFLEKTLSLSF